MKRRGFIGALLAAAAGFCWPGKTRAGLLQGVTTSSEHWTPGVIGKATLYPRVRYSVDQDGYTRISVDGYGRVAEIPPPPVGFARVNFTATFLDCGSLLHFSYTDKQMAAPLS